MPQPDDFTVTLLHRLQDERTTPQGGWMALDELGRALHLTTVETKHLDGPLRELFGAGMIERRFNAAKARDEWRSRGVQPVGLAFHGDHAEPDLLAEARAVDPAPTTIFPVPIKGTVHAAFVLDYRTDRWATMCGKSIKDPATVKHERRPVQCPKCAEALL